MKDNELKMAHTAVAEAVNTPSKFADWAKTQVFNRACGEMVPHKREIKGTTRYEKLSILVVVASWGLLTAIILGVHFGNYDKETRTSSKSPTHSSFYEVVGGDEKKE